MIDASLASFLREGLGIHIGTRNERLEPNGARAVAAEADADGRHLSIFMAEVAARRVLPDLRSNGQAAVTFARPIDDRACQIKGTFLDVRPATAEERPRIQAQWGRFLDNLEHIGISRAGITDWVTWPAVVVRIEATAVFDQTPGKSAGAPLS